MEKLSINKLKWIRNLHSKKFRDSEGYFIAEGEKILAEILEFAPASIFLIVCTQESLEKIKQRDPFDIFIASPSEFERVSLLKSPQGILVVLKNTLSEEKLLDQNKSILVLDNIQDPGNLGTILRTADWFGINQIYCSLNTVDCFNPRVVQASMGSLFRLIINYGDLSEFLSKQTLPIYGALLEGESCFKVKIKESAILIIK